ncbi:septation protein SepH [Corynebacterium sp.]|uniref:septation protein SepH n=1 Tax=Corynebacterium sp. TaxID=1720 RepID=UPI0026DC78AD|nr:septation protein SepH [Corynebacterium sp.]MDO5032717.1 septation protein SepH [Corynebacterium sp.]
MRELFLATSDSTDTSLVLTTEDGEEFFLAVTEELRTILRPAEATETTESTSTSGTESESESSSSFSAPSEGPGSAEAASRTLSHPMARPSLHGKAQQEERTAIRLHPSEIQSRIRAGATAAEIAEELEVPESRIEPFAHPVLLERANVADMAKQAHPVREDGPAKLTLWEILATAFAARGHSLSESTWDAYRHQGEPWIVRVTWRAGLSENEAEWTFKQSMSSPATVEARNSVAADLTDPDFVQPVRSLTSVGRGERYDKAIAGEHSNLPTGVTDITDYTAPTVLPSRAGAETAAESGDDAQLGDVPLDSQGSTQPSATAEEDAGASGDSASGSARAEGRAEGSVGSEHSTTGTEAREAGEDFLQNPEPKPAKRRRRAVTPHWEDVLLGVRANTKRPRD